MRFRWQLFLGVIVMLNFSQAQVPEDRYHQALEMVGILSAAYLYETYLGLGQLAEIHAAQSQPDSLLQHRLENVIRVLTGVHDNLKVFSSSELSPEDSTYVHTLLEVNLLLIREAGALKRYWETQTAEDGKIYLAYNEQARQALEALYGLDLSP